MRKITVEPEQLISIAGRMDDDNQEYVRLYTQLFELIDSVPSSWRGIDMEAFVTQVSSYQDSCRQLSFLCSMYTDFLRTAANSYRDVQEELRNRALRLQY